MRRSSRIAERGRKKRQEMREAYGAVEGWTVELTVFQGAAPTGRDRGVVWFEDGRMYFVGERTSFGLAPGQVAGGLRRNWSLAGLRCSITMNLHAHTAGGSVALGLDPLPADGYEPSPDAHFASVLTKWTSEKGPPDGQLPPLALGPDAPSTRTLLVRAVASTAFWVVVATLLAFLGLFTAWWVVPPAAAFGGCLLILWSDLWAPRLRWLAWRDRRRLRRT